MNADIPPLKVWIEGKHLGLKEGYEHGYAFAIQSYKARALQFHVLLNSGAHFRHIPLHHLCHDHRVDNPTPLNLSMLQLWDCFSYRPTVTVFDLLKAYQCDCILKNEDIIQGTYWFTVDWLPDSDSQAGFLLQPDQNKCAHVILLDNGQIAALPTNRIVFKDAYFIGNKPTAIAKRYKTSDTIYNAEDCERWSVADTDDTYY